MAHLEPGVLDLADDGAGADQLPVGEHVPVDERAGHHPAVVARSGDAVVQQPSARNQLVLDEREVRGVLRDADVLGEPDRADRVEPGVADVAVVGVPNLGELLQPFAHDGGLPPLGLLLGQRRPQGVHPAAGGEADHAGPAAADVEQPVAGPEPQLVEHQLVLVLLGLLESGVHLGVVGAGVGHRLAQHVLVEGVGHVVVAVDGLGVTGLGVAQPLCGAAPLRQCLLRRRGHRAQRLPAQRAHDRGQGQRGRALQLHAVGHRLERLVGVPGVHAGEGEVAGDVGPGHPEVGVGGCRGQVGGAARGGQVHPDGRILGTGGAPVVGGEPDLEVVAREGVHDLAEVHPVPAGGAAGSLERGHLLRTALAYRSSRRAEGS